MHAEHEPSAAEILDRLEVWGRKFGLDAIRRLLHALGDPQREIPTILVAGTNGKGSTSAALASILTAAGFRCGLYTSPHLEHVEERLRIDGEAIDEAELGVHLRRALDAAGPTPPTYFESLTAAAWLHFAARGVNAAVFEVGLGGRLDATNVSEPLLSVITQVARDHPQQLGWTLTSIAGEKAGVMRPGRPCLIWPGRPEVERELSRCAAVCGARLVDAAAGVVLGRVDQPGAEAGSERAGHAPSLRTGQAEYRFEAPLEGGHQLANLALAVRAAEEFCALNGRRLAPDAAARGIEAVRWPGRLEWVEAEVHGETRRILFDAAHNPAGAAALRRYLDERFDRRGAGCRSGLRNGSQSDRPNEADRSFDLLYGALDDKRPERCLRLVAERAQRIVLTAPDHRRAVSPEALLDLLPATRTPAAIAADAARALDRCLLPEADGALSVNGPRPLVVTGSLYLVGEVRAALRARCGVPAPARDIPTGCRRTRRE